MYKHRFKNKQRHIDFKFQVKSLNEDGTFEGYGSVFGVTDYGNDVIIKGAFLQTIADIKASGRPLTALWQHNSDKPCGIFTEITEDATGLYVKGQLALDTQVGAEAYALLKMGAISGLSIGYAATDYEIDPKTGVRTLKVVTLYEISLVTFPMNDSARIDNVKMKIENGLLPDSIADFEKFLRDAGFSRKNSVEIANHGIKGLLQCDAASDREAVPISALSNFKLPTFN